MSVADLKVGLEGGDVLALHLDELLECLSVEPGA